MKEKQIPFNFMIPRKILNELRRESEETGVPVSAIIKSRIARVKNQNEKEMEVAP